jgi:Zn-dependent protease with chaperone function
MNETLHGVSYVSAGAASALFSAIWEGAVLAVAVGLCLRLIPRLSSAARSVVWLNVFVLLVLLHFVPALAGGAADGAIGEVRGIHLDARWSLVVVGAWLALSVWRAVQMVLGMVHLRRLARRAIPIETDAALQALLADAAGRRPAQLCISEEVRRPSVLGFFHPRVLLPPALVEGLTAQELEQVVLHEMEHLRRGDDWTNLVQKLGLVLFPLNPVLLWVEQRLCAERELACDDRVIRSSAGRKAYALCLARLAEFSFLQRSFSLMLGLWERRPELIRRVQRIVAQPVHSMGRRPAMFATGGVLAGALGCAVALAHSPQLVSFVPAHPAVVMAAPLDPHAVARALGGTPQLAKATMPVSQTDTMAPAGRPKSVTHRVHRAVVKAAQTQEPEGSQIAGLEAGSEPASLPRLERREIIVLTEFTAFPAPPRVVLAVSSSPQQRGPVAGDAGGNRRAARPVVLPARYAIVPTPAGWLIIQI